jgi:hypothetical protein
LELFYLLVRVAAQRLKQLGGVVVLTHRGFRGPLHVRNLNFLSGLGRSFNFSRRCLFFLQIHYDFFFLNFFNNFLRCLSRYDYLLQLLLLLLFFFFFFFFFFNSVNPLFIILFRLARLLVLMSLEVVLLLHLLFEACQFIGYEFITSGLHV